MKKEAEKYKESFEKLYNKASKDLQTRINNAKGKATADKEVILFVKSVIDLAEKL